MIGVVNVYDVKSNDTEQANAIAYVQRKCKTRYDMILLLYAIHGL